MVHVWCREEPRLGSCGVPRGAVVWLVWGATRSHSLVHVGCHKEPRFGLRGVLRGAVVWLEWGAAVLLLHAWRARPGEEAVNELCLVHLGLHLLRSRGTLSK